MKPTIGETMANWRQIDRARELGCTPRVVFYAGFYITITAGLVGWLLVSVY